VKPAGLRASEIGLERQWRVGPTGYAVSDALFATQMITGGQRSRLPLAPVHLRCLATVDGWRLSWLRRSRLDADDWAQSEIPLGENAETYAVEIAGRDGVVKRRVEVGSSSHFYSRTQAQEDFGAVPSAMRVSVRQISSAVGPGMAASAELALL